MKIYKNEKVQKRRKEQVAGLQGVLGMGIDGMLKEQLAKFYTIYNNARVIVHHIWVPTHAAPSISNHTTTWVMWGPGDVVGATYGATSNGIQMWSRNVVNVAKPLSNKSNLLELAFINDQTQITITSFSWPVCQYQ